MTNSPENVETCSTAVDAATLEEVLWGAIGSGAVTRKHLALVMEVSEETVARVLAGQTPKADQLRRLISSRRMPLQLRDDILKWYLAESDHEASRRVRAPHLADLDANKDGRVDGRDAVVLDGQALSKGSAALEALCGAMTTGRLTHREREVARLHLAEMKERMARCEQVLEVEAGATFPRVVK